MKIYRLLLADKAKKRWDKNKTTWNKLNALKEALSSKNIRREELALHYLRFGNAFAPKTELAIRYNYFLQLRPLIIRIKNNKDGESEQAGYLLDDMGDPKEK